MPWTPTHRVPPGGLQAFVNNQPSTPLDPGLEVQVAEYAGEWARVVASNGWECWVNGRALLPLAPPAPPVTVPAGPPPGPPPPPLAPAPPPGPPVQHPPARLRAGIPMSALIGILLGTIAIGSLGGYFFLNTQAADVTLEQAGTQSPNAFQPSLAVAPTPSPAPTAPAPAPSEAPKPPPPGPNGLAIYGGTGNNRLCDKQKLIDFLTTHPAEGRAWAGVEGITTAEIPAFIRQLDPEILSRDTRVTNHGFVNGRATAYQSVFQAGTAVLVNQYGYPVARCLCGNPLTPPIVSSRYRYVGPQWRGFNQTTIIIYVAPPGNVPNVPTAVPSGPQPTPSFRRVNGNYTMTLRLPASSFGNAQALGLTCEPTGGTSFPAQVTQSGNVMTMVVAGSGNSGQSIALTGTVDPLGSFVLKGTFGVQALGVDIVYSGKLDAAGGMDGQFSEQFTESGNTGGCNVRMTGTPPAA
jgi:hypothetical protein